MDKADFYRRMLKIYADVDGMNIINAAVYAGFCTAEELADEYQPEVDEIIKLLPKCTNVDELKETIQEVFDDYFCNAGIIDVRYRVMARRTWNLWEEYRGLPQTPFPEEELPPHRKPAVIRVP